MGQWWKSGECGSYMTEIDGLEAGIAVFTRCNHPAALEMGAHAQEGGEGGAHLWPLHRPLCAHRPQILGTSPFPPSHWLLASAGH